MDINTEFYIEEKRFLNMKLNNRKSGFTLAEVLVTLMIIGVIAAMTIPSLMQSTSQQEYKAAYKKAVSMLNQAITLNYALDGEDASDHKGTDLMDLLTKRLNVISSDATGHILYTADGMKFTITTSKNNDNQGANAISVEGDCASDPTKACSLVVIDVNGDKGPSTMTKNANQVKDTFEVAVYPQRVLPNGDVMSQVLYGAGDKPADTSSNTPGS